MQTFEQITHRKVGCPFGCSYKDDNVVESFELADVDFNKTPRKYTDSVYDKGDIEATL
jgi:hypothetical protein